MAYMTPGLRGLRQGVDVSVKGIGGGIAARNVYSFPGVRNQPDKRGRPVTKYLQAGRKYFHGSHKLQAASDKKQQIAVLALLLAA
jgi:hypothetical protein